MFVERILLAVILLALMPAALAHVTLEQPTAPASSYYKAVFRIGHGCDGSPTVRVEIAIPEGVVSVKPMPKPGWSLVTRRAKLKTPYQSHGKTIDEDVSAVIWDGGFLRHDFYDEFVVSLRTSDLPGRMYFKVAQICEKGRLDWVEIPVGERPLHDLPRPAALLEVLPAQEKPHH